MNDSNNETPSSKNSARQKKFSEADVQAQQQSHRAVHTIYEWFERTFPGQANAVLFALGGFLLAVVFITFGFWNSIVVAGFVVAGLCFGQYRDGNPKLWKHIKALFGTRR